jgi:hypothetical protein
MNDIKEIKNILKRKIETLQVLYEESENRNVEMGLYLVIADLKRLISE